MGVSESGGGDSGRDNMYRRSAEPVLVLLSNLYSDDDEILVSNSRYSSYSVYTDTDYFALLTTTLKKCIRFYPKTMFYSKQCYKNGCCSSA